MPNNEKKSQQELEDYLAKIHRTVSESEALIQGVEMRIRETDNLLAEQGLTREQVHAIRFTPEQIKAVNEELKRQGLPPLEDVPEPGDVPPVVPNVPLTGRSLGNGEDSGDVKEDMENRKRKFNVMMKNYRL